jgi:FMN-dependent NADH-azoreductase
LAIKSIAGKVMKNLLLVTASLHGKHSRSVRLARELIELLQDTLGRFHVTERELGDGTIRHLSGEYLQAISTAPIQRTPRQKQLARVGDGLIEEVEAADVIVIAAPMYNFTIPSTLKSWFDHVARSGRTFRYTPEGRPQGLLKDKKVYVVESRGGFYGGDSPANEPDFHEPYLKAMLGFIGLNDVSFVHVEGQDISPSEAQAGVREAREVLATLVLRPRVAA